MRKGFLLLIISGFIILSCNNPLKRKYKSDTYTEDISNLLEAKKITNEDVIKITSYINFHEQEIIGLTYENLLKKIKLEETQNLINSAERPNEEEKTSFLRTISKTMEHNEAIEKAIKEKVDKDWDEHFKNNNK